MFRLEQLDIHGFKSFYDPEKLTFPAAMTAVVGPNGCGKSNICDALIWVLGENRASHIRGETMEDVIFQGSARRRALSMGEVTLTLGTINTDGWALAKTPTGVTNAGSAARMSRARSRDRLRGAGG